MASKKKPSASALRGDRQDQVERGVIHIHPAYQRRGPKVDLVSQGRIGLGLRGMYDDLLDQPVPDHLADLIRRLS